VRDSVVAIVLTGPTAVGKTEMAVELAEELDGEIISADSRQIYRHMDIGTAKPEEAVLSRVRHHLIDVVTPDQTYSAGRFGRTARQLLLEVEARGHTPIIAGGSGLYISALVDGFFEEADDEQEIRRGLQRELAAKRPEDLYRELGAADPVTQTQLSPRDTRRIIRALVLARSGAGSTSDRLATMNSLPLRQMPLMFCLALDRQQVYDRVDRRVHEMLAAGWIDEVRALVALGYGRGAPGMEGIGYREILQHLCGQLALADAVVATQQRTRHYAKRQLTWFRRDRRLRWLSIDRIGRDGAIERVLRHYGRCVHGHGAWGCRR